MKIDSLPIIVVIVTVLSVAGIAIMVSEPTQLTLKQLQASDAQSQDILNATNIIPEINARRADLGLNPLTEDEALLKVVKTSVEVAHAELTGTNQFTTKYTVVTESELPYYSAKGAVKMWMGEPGKFKILTAHATKIGVWVAYFIKKGERPTPWVTVLVQ